MNVTATDVSLAFDGEPVLENVSIRADRGEVLTVVGPSGTGKTTLLRLLAAFRPPDSGTISWGGTDIWSLSEEQRLDVRRRIGMVFQEPSLFNAPVRRNVAYGIRVRKSWPERLRIGVRDLLGEGSLSEPVGAALEAVGLSDKADQNALTLSGGEAQRVAFARALAVDPGIILLDEPTSNLDPRNTAVLEDAVRRASARGVTVVMATHDMNQAERLSDRVAFVFDGQVIETGPPEQLFEHPTDPRTKQFVDGELLVDSPDERTERFVTHPSS